VLPPAPDPVLDPPDPVVPGSLLDDVQETVPNNTRPTIARFFRMADSSGPQSSAEPRGKNEGGSGAVTSRTQQIPAMNAADLGAAVLHQEK
jgi:hypothetical protein